MSLLWFMWTISLNQAAMTELSIYGTQAKITNEDYQMFVLAITYWSHVRFLPCNTW